MVVYYITKATGVLIHINQATLILFKECISSFMGDLGKLLVPSAYPVDILYAILKRHGSLIEGLEETGTTNCCSTV